MSSRWVVVQVVCLLACGLGMFIGNILPPPNENYLNSFNEGRALTDLSKISRDIGTRAGSQHSLIQQMQQYIEETIKSLQPAAVSSGWKLSIKEYPVQGKYQWKQQHYFYENINNILVTLEPIGFDYSTCRGSLLVNTHIDSAVGSPGAGDDGAAVVIAIESIRVLIQTPPSPFAVPMLFLFNNGEELGLLGSHGFVVNYPEIIQQIGGFINLEAAGTYGPESLFQASKNAPWLIREFAKSAPYPRGSIVAQDLFQTGVIPSDTDFRVFTREGNLSGIDMALYRNGYLYHTPRDSYENICPGTLQHFGSNVLSILSTLANSEASSNLLKSSPECKLHKNSEPISQTIFFDIAGIIMICYEENINTAIIIITITAILLNIFQNSRAKFYQVITIFLAIIGSFIGSLCPPILIGYVMHAIVHAPMMWYQSPISAFIMYFPVAMSGYFFSIGLFSFFINSKKSSSQQFITIYLLILSCIWTLFVCVGYYYHVGAIFLGILFSICYTISTTFSWRTEFIFLIFSVPIFLISDISYQFFETIVPIAGRAGLKPIELIVSGFCGIIITLIFQPFSALWIVKSNRKVVWKLCLLFTVASIIVFAVFYSQNSVYSAQTPKRVLVEHINTLDSDESYFLFIPADGIPFHENEMPKDSSPQLKASSRKHHVKLPTIPCLNIEDGRRWEMKAPYQRIKNQPKLSVVQESNHLWSIHLDAPGSFGSEVILSPLEHILEIDTVADINNNSTESDVLKVRLFDGNSVNHFSFQVKVEKTVKLDVFFNYLDSDVNAPINQVLQQLPDNFAPVGCISFRKTVLLVSPSSS